MLLRFNVIPPTRPRREHWRAAAGVFVQELLEALALVVILGLLPVGAHWLFSLEKPGDSRSWVVPELYLFVMVTCGQAVAEAFRNPEGLGRTLVCMFGSLGVLAGAGAYGILYVHPTSPDVIEIESWLQAHVVSIMIYVGVGYAIYRAIALCSDAWADMMGKNPSAACQEQK